MSKLICRLDDKTDGFCTICRKKTGGHISSASDNVICEGSGVATDNDTVISDCGHEGRIIASATKLFVNGKPAALDNDQFVGSYIGTIASGATKSFAA